MHRVREYLKKAERAEATARQMSREDHRQHFLQLAAEWRALAAAVEAEAGQYDPLKRGKGE